MKSRYQRGSLIDQGDRWVVRHYDYAIKHGEVTRIRRKYVLGSKRELPNKRKAQMAFDEILRKINEPGYRPVSGCTFADFATRWLKTIAIHHKQSTRYTEKAVIERDLLPTFGSMRLKEITMEAVQNFINTWQLSPKTLRNVITLMQGMWNYVEPWEGVTVNPFKRGINGRMLLKFPAMVKPVTYSYSIEEANAIIAKAEALDHKWGLLFRTLAECGMRPGELAAMKREDLQGRVITISQTYYCGIFQPAKTKNGIREFPISRELASDLAKFIANTDDSRNLHGTVWTNGQGEPLWMGDVIKYILEPILVELGIRAKLDKMGADGGFYPFRHMVATQLTRLKVPKATIQKRIGHAIGSTVTDQHYIHSVSEDEFSAADMFGSLITPKREGETLQ